MASNYTAGRYKSWDDNGNPYPSARLYTYISGTTTHQAAFTDSTLATPCTYTSDGAGGLYIAMDARGEAQVWVGALVYTFTLKTPLGATIQAPDNGITDASATLALSSGSAGIGFQPAGTGAVATTVEKKLQTDITNYDKYTAAQVADSLSGAATLDVTTALQAALTGLSAGQQLRIIGANKITTMLTCSASNVSIVLDDGASIIHNTPNFVALKMTGANVTVRGGLNGGFIGPASWDGTNTAPTYGVIWMAGNNGTVKTRLSNVKKVGIWFKDVSDGTVQDCVIEGNYPTGSWTGTEVGHMGVAFDPGTAFVTSNFKLINSTIKSCVQGVLPANYGTGGIVQGLVITGNVFEGCWNHGVYSNFTNGAVITGNNFNRCQIPVVVSGDNNVVSGNTLYTHIDASGDARDSVGISIRDGSGNVVDGNTIKGTVDAANPACITISDISSIKSCERNIVTNNTIVITAGNGTPIRLTSVANPLRHNIVHGNIITCSGNGVASGAIQLDGLPAGGNYNNKVFDNIITLTAQSEGVYASYMTNADISGNTVDVAWNAGAATNVYTVRLFNPVGCAVRENTSLVRTGFGTNITFYAYREDNTASGNFLRDPVNAVGGSGTYAHTVLVANSGLTVDQVGTGVPNFHAKIGSIWRRSDGGTSTTLYIKETGTDASGWVAK